MIDLKDIWKKQKDFQLYFYDPDNMSIDDKIKLTKEYILCIHRELGEVLNVIPWKLHRKNTKTYDTEHLCEELIDCFKYLLNLSMIHGMTPESFEKMFFDKSAIVEKRYFDENQSNQQKLPF